MTTIQEQLAALLLPLAAGGVSPEVQIQDAPYPYVVYRRLASRINNTLEGNGNPRINQTFFEVTSWALSYGGAVTLAAAVAAAMQGWTVQNVLQSELDEYEADVKAYRVIQTYSVWSY
jgi:Protein of unknown function (DUF3168)